MKVESESEVVQLCPTLSDPMDCSLPGSSIHGSFQARVLECGAIAVSEMGHERLVFFVAAGLKKKSFRRTQEILLKEIFSGDTIFSV